MTSPEDVDPAAPAEPMSACAALPVSAGGSAGMTTGEMVTVRPRSLPVLAPLLPLLLLVGLGIAGMTDPPAPVPGSTGQAVSRLHVPSPGTAEPDHPKPDVARRDLPGHGPSGRPR